MKNASIFQASPPAAAQPSRTTSSWFLSVLGNRVYSYHKLKPGVSARAVSDT